MTCYGAALGLAPDGLPGQNDYVDEVTATVAAPSRLAAWGVAHVERGEKLVLTNHDNGYWTVFLPASGRKVKLPLAYRARFGVVPDPELPDGRVPSRITGRVVDPAILQACAFRTAASAQYFTLEFSEGGWWLRLDPGGEKRLVPL